MNSVEEIALLKRRIGGVESELADLRSWLIALEVRVSRPSDTTTGAARERAPSAALPPPPPPPPPPATFPEVERTLPPPLPTLPASRPESVPSARPVLPPLPVTPPPPPPAAVGVSQFKFVEDPVLPPRTNPFREWLEPLQLWPPDGEKNTEVRLGAWWTTRIGALLAVIGVVFLGLYVSRGSPPWIRLLEVAAATAGVLALGSRLERKLPKFGAVVFGAGLALSYFCAFAAFAVRPMRVIEDPLVAMAVQVAVVAGILVVAWRRNSPLVASMAAALGYVSAFVGLQDQRIGFGPWVILLLGVATVVLRLARNWPGPSALAMLGTWAFLGAATFVRRSGVELQLGALWMWCALHLVLFTARDWIVAWRGGTLGTFERALQVTNSSLAVAVGLLGAARAGGDATQPFFFGSGVAMLLLLWAWRAVKVDALGPIFGCKAAGLIALGVIDALAGQARCLVLLAQAFVMLVSARQSHQRWLRVATALMGAVAIAFYVDALRPGGAEFASAATALDVLFLAGAMALVAALHRWLDFSPTKTALGAAVVGLLAVVTASRWALHGWTPAVEVGLGVLLAAVALGLGAKRAASLAGGILLIAAHGEMWVFETLVHGRAALWGSEAIVLASGILAALTTRGLADAVVRVRWRLGLVAVLAMTLIVVGAKGLASAPALALGYGVALAVVVLTRIRKSWPLAILAAPLSAFAWALLLARPANVSGAWLWAAGAAGWTVPIWFAGSRLLLASVEPAAGRRWLPGVHTWLAMAVTLLALGKNLHGDGRVLGFALAAVASSALVWRPRLFAALEASWGFWAGAVFCGLRGAEPAALWLAAPAAWGMALALRSRFFVELRHAKPRWRSDGDGVQGWIAAALTLVALHRTWSGEGFVIGVACAALAIVALVWRPGLRAALEISWALWLVALCCAGDADVTRAWWLVAVVSWVPAVVFARAVLPAAEPGPWSFWRRGRTTIQVGLATAFTLLAIGKNFSGSAQLGALAGAALIVLGLAWALRVRPALESSWMLWCGAIVTAASTRAGGVGWSVAALAWVPVLVLARGGRGGLFLRDAPPGWRPHAAAVQVGLATILGAVVAVVRGGAIELAALAALIVVAAALWRWAGVPAARPAAAAFAALAWAEALRFVLEDHAMGWSLALMAVLGVAVVTVALPLLLGRDLERAMQAKLRWPAAGAGLALAVAAFVVQRGDVAPFATIGCGLAAVATFLAGLYARSRPHRLCGLAGLALCIPRAFIVDLHSTLHRIAAFVALGVVLLVVGFSYDRFRHFIDDDKKI